MQLYQTLQLSMVDRVIRPFQQLQLQVVVAQAEPQQPQLMVMFHQLQLILAVQAMPAHQQYPLLAEIIMLLQQQLWTVH